MRKLCELRNLFNVKKSTSVKRIRKHADYFEILCRIIYRASDSKKELELQFNEEVFIAH